MGAVGQFCAVLPMGSFDTWWKLLWFAGLPELHGERLRQGQELMASHAGGFFSYIKERVRQQPLSASSLKRIIKRSCRHNPITSPYSWITLCTRKSMQTIDNSYKRQKECTEQATCYDANLYHPVPQATSNGKAHCQMTDSVFLCGKRNNNS